MAVRDPKTKTPASERPLAPAHVERNPGIPLDLGWVRACRVNLGAIIALGAGALVGALVGGLTGRAAGEMIERGFRSEPLAALAGGLEAGHPALVLTVTDPKAALSLITTELVPYRAESVERVRLERE